MVAVAYWAISLTTVDDREREVFDLKAKTKICQPLIMLQAHKSGCRIQVGADEVQIQGLHLL